MEQLAYEDAAELLEQALELFELGGDAQPEQRLQLLLSLAEAQAASGQFPRTRETLDEAAALAQELDDTEALVQAAIQLGRVTEVGYADEKIIATVEAALEKCGAGDSAARASLLSVLSTEELWRTSTAATSSPARRSRWRGASAIPRPWRSRSTVP